jgi:hypothetical protein
MPVLDDWRWIGGHLGGDDHSGNLVAPSSRTSNG